MIDLWYLDTKTITPKDVETLLAFLPQNLVNEITRFRFHEDRRLKLFGRLIVESYYKNQHLAFNWNDWKISPAGKPYCNPQQAFNISHAGTYVLVAFSTHEVGVDIERVVPFDVQTIRTYFHPEEAEYILHSTNSNSAFFKLWTRKEAYLKAIGKGIVDGLHHENCLPDVLNQTEKWFLHSLSFVPEYHVAVCTNIANCPITIRQLHPNQLERSQSENQRLTKKNKNVNLFP